MKNLLLFAVLLTLPLLLGGCGEKAIVEPVAGRQTEEPVTKTKLKLENVDYNELEARKGIIYLKDSDAPYTGKMFRLYKNGQKKYEGQFRNGRQDGLYMEWHENGNKKRVSNFKEGKLDGLQTYWYENGKKEAESQFKNSKQNGEVKRWYENGKMWCKLNWKNGKMDGLSVMWHKNGQQSSEAIFKDDEIIEGSAKWWNNRGEPVKSEEEAYQEEVKTVEPLTELRTWTAVNGKEVEAEFVSNEEGIVKLKLKSGKFFEVPANKLSKEDNELLSYLDKPEGVNEDEELEFLEDVAYLKGSDTSYTGKAYGLYENGKKESELNFKDGKENGPYSAWYENGKKMYEGYWKNGKLDGLQVRWYKSGQKKSEGNFKNGKPDVLVEVWHENGQKLREAHYKDGVVISERYWNSKGQSVDSIEKAEAE